VHFFHFDILATEDGGLVGGINEVGLEGEAVLGALVGHFPWNYDFLKAPDH
jgi:hypothetical protein